MVCLEKLENCHFNPIINRVHHASSFLASTVFPYCLKIQYFSEKTQIPDLSWYFFISRAGDIYSSILLISFYRPLNGNESLFI